MQKFTLFLMAMLLVISSTSAQTIVFSEDFESGSMPAGWGQTTNATDGGWQVGDAVSLGSQFFPFSGNNTKFAGTNDDACNCDKSDDFLYTADIDLTSYSGQTVFLSFKQYYFALNYQGSQEVATIEYSLNGGTTWSVLTQIQPLAVWETALYDLSSLAGNNIKIGFRYNDGGGWTYGMGIDDVTVYVPADRNVVLTELDLPNYFKLNTTGGVDIKGTVFNQGGAAITDMVVSYTVNGGTPVTAQLQGLNIAPLTSYDFNHGTPWVPSATGNFTVEVSIISVNGQPDVDPSDNILTHDVVVYDQAYPRVVLYETFTSSTCAPCKPGNENFENVMVNVPDSQYASVKYQMSWPGDGDPYYTDEGGVRRGYYGVSSVPRLEIDGGYDGNSNSFEMADHEGAFEVPAYVQINAEYQIWPDSQTVKVCATVEAMKNLGNRTLYIAITESTTKNNVESNGETEFYNVMKKMLPDANGQTIAISDGMHEKICETYTFQGDYRLPNNANDPIDHSIEHSVESFDSLLAVVWIQNDDNKLVLNSANAKKVDEFTTVNEITNTVTNTKIYPNPATDEVNIEFILESSDNIQIRIFDVTGKVVMNVPVRSYAAGTNRLTLDTDKLTSGVYHIEVLSNEGSTVKKLIVQ